LKVKVELRKEEENGNKSIQETDDTVRHTYVLERRRDDATSECEGGKTK
jgi:hypothetical protein